MNRSEVDRQKVSPMMRQYLETKDNYEDVILFYRIGDFYEMFFEDAINVSHDLELTLTGKNAGLDEKIPMCGVPHHAANIYIDKLIDKGYKVAICEQVEDPKDAKGIVKREVIRIVSKGTVMSDDMLDAKNNNFIGALKDLGHCFSLSYADLSTGEFISVLVEYELEKIINEIVNDNITELIINGNVDPRIINTLKNNYSVTISKEEVDEEIPEYKDLYKDIKDVRIISSVCVLLNYLTSTQKRSIDHLQNVKVKDYKTYLKMDIHTKRNLELTENLRTKERTYSLLWLLDKTKTAMGSRMLKQMIENPLIDKEEIENRYDMVSKLLEEFLLKDELKDLLKEVYDLERLAGRVSFGNANARDLLQLKSSLKVLPRIKEIVSILGGNSPIDPSSIPDGMEENWKNSLDVLKHTKKLEEINYSNFEAIFFPGGHGPMFDLAYYEPLCEILNHFNDNNKVIAAICHGVCALIPAIDNYNIWLFNNKNLTSFTNKEEKLAKKEEMVPFLLETKLKQLGAKFKEYPPFAKNVVVDGKLITGQNQNSAKLIASEIINTFKK